MRWMRYAISKVIFMRALIADSSTAARSVCRRVLETYGYVVTDTDSGDEAFSMLSSTKSPQIALLEWDLPSMVAPEICRQLKAYFEETPSGKVRPYIIIISGRNSINDITEALNSGADDYLIKPWNQEELAARLRVAERTIAVQSELNNQIRKLQDILKKHNLYSDIDSLYSHSEPEEDHSTEKKTAAWKLLMSHYKRLNSLQKGIEFPEYCTTVFTQLGIGKAVTKPITQESLSNISYQIWAPMLLIRQHIWLDIIYEISAVSAERFFHKFIMSPPTSETETREMLLEMMNVATNAIRPAFTTDSSDITIPFPAKAISHEGRIIPFPTAGHAQAFQIIIDDIVIAITIFEYRYDIIEKSISLAAPGDILADSLRSPKNQNAIILKAGTLIGKQYSEKLKTFSAQPDEKQTMIRVVEQHPISRFCIPRI